jgi:hypothetical protein
VRIVAVTRVAERQGDVGAVFADRLHGFGRLGLEVGDGDAGMGDRERREQARDENGRRRRECDQPHEARAQTAQLGEFLRGRLDRQCDGGRVAREHSPGLGETHAASDPLDHGDLEPGFEAAQVLADRRLAVSERGRGAGDRSGVGDRPHDPQALHVEIGGRIRH